MSHTLQSAQPMADNTYNRSECKSACLRFASDPAKARCFERYVSCMTFETYVGLDRLSIARALSPFVISRRSCCRRELQRHSVHAVTQAGQLRSIIEDMTEMSIAARAEYFGTCFSQAVVNFLQYVPLGDWSPEARPARVRFEFR